uniref:Uncharacterized protein n=1 Tax=Oryza meridionalis TaxID=40149 RepID=A0A0E0CTR8_9ORYZ
MKKKEKPTLAGRRQRERPCIISILNCICICICLANRLVLRISSDHLDDRRTAQWAFAHPVEQLARAL